MSMVSERSKKIIFTLAYISAIVLLASAGFASEGGEGAHHADHAAGQMKDFGWRVLNFAVLIGIVVWALKKADVKGSLAARQAEIEKSLKDAETARDAAEAKLREYSVKLDQAAKEIDELHAAIVREGEQEKNRIIASILFPGIFLRTFWMELLTLCHISSGSCSTHPGFGKYWGNSS